MNRKLVGNTFIEILLASSLLLMSAFVISYSQKKANLLHLRAMRQQKALDFTEDYIEITRAYAQTGHLIDEQNFIVWQDKLTAALPGVQIKYEKTDLNCHILIFTVDDSLLLRLPIVCLDAEVNDN